MSVKEFFVFADPDGNLYHLTVDGSVVKDGARLSPPVILRCFAVKSKFAYELCLSEHIEWDRLHDLEKRVDGSR